MMIDRQFLLDESMFRHLRSCLLIAASFAVAFHCQHAIAQSQAEYRFSPVNQYGINLTATYWNPILDYVSEKAGVKLVMKIGRTSADTTAYVLANEVDFVFSNHMFSPEREKRGWKVFARRNSPPVAAELVVPAQSPIRELGQLAGKSVVYPGPEALIGYKLPQAELIRNDVKVDVVFAGNHDAALVQLFAGKAQAAGGNAQLIAGWATRENKNYRVIWKSAPVQDLAVMASSKVPPDVVQRVRDAFIGMTTDPKGWSILETSSRAVGMPYTINFVASDGREYVAEREFFKTAPPELR